MKWLIRIGFVVAFVVVVVAVFWLGYWTGSPATMAGHQHPAEHANVPVESTLWTCPMHPEIKLPEFGPCPKCGMDLVPMAKGDDTGPRQIAMTPSSVKLAAIESTAVTRQFVSLPVRMVGKVDYDETRIRTIASRVPGRLERLFVDYTGIRVERDDHLVDLYSPNLLTAQAELIEAHKRAQAAAGEAGEFLSDSDRRGYEGAREKLILWGLTAAQVDAIVARGTPEDRMLIRSPAAGVVVQKNVNQGDYVKEGTLIYRIADLSHLWIQLDAYEQDLPWLRYGQSVSVTAEALPGERFAGWISFLDPTVDDRRRTVRVRVNVQNADGRLKPGMFVRAIVQARLGEGGKVLAPRLAGKWISPMHPEVVKDGPGKCDVCGMDLVPAESLGYTSTGTAGKPLVVPATAVLVTGTRAVVYVALEGMKKPTFEGREVILGPRAGDFYIIVAGLQEHELVVTNGAFRIDSAMQIQAKPSMMSMRGEQNSFRGPDTAAFRQALVPLYRGYLDMQVALAADDVDAARRAAGRLRAAAGAAGAVGLAREARARWEEEAPVVLWESRAAEEAASIAVARDHFQPLSRSVLGLERTFGHAGADKVVEVFCPMAFDDKGASWLQAEGRTANPYFGASMLACGIVREEFPGVAGEPAAAVPTRRLTGTAAELAAVRARLDPVYAAYFAIRRALAGDDAAAAASAAQVLANAVDPAVDGLGDAAVDAVAALRAAIAAPFGDAIEAQRQRFETLTKALSRLQAVTGHAGDAVLYRMHCPMAFDNRGADWLQRDAELANPYFGASMLRCGSVIAELDPQGGPR